MIVTCGLFACAETDESPSQHKFVVDFHELTFSFGVEAFDSATKQEAVFIYVILVFAAYTAKADFNEHFVATSVKAIC